MNANVGVNDWLLVPIPFRCLGNGSKEGEIVVPTIVPVSPQKLGFQSQRQPTATIWEVVETAGFARNSRVSEGRISV
jgi:hypothetical protein